MVHNSEAGHPFTGAVLASIEITSALRPETLPALIEILRQSPARVAVAQLVTDWRAAHTGELAGIAIKAAGDLDRLMRRRSIPSDPSRALDSPNVPALYDMACQRARRSPLVHKRRRFEILAQRLAQMLASDHRRRQIEHFLREPVRPVDAGWLSNFLRRPRTTTQRRHPQGGDSPLVKQPESARSR